MGGTNTCISIMEPNGPRVIENAEGLRTTPSYISISEEGEEFTAVAAKRIAIQNINSSFYGTKFFFGRKYSDEFIQKILKRFPFKIEKGEEDKIIFKTDKDAEYEINQISVPYLKYVKEQADALIGKPVKKAVMIVPGFINEEGMSELKETVREGGMDVVKFIEESKAAAYAYELDKNEDKKNIIVFNFGGLNFSLTHLEKINIDGEIDTKKTQEDNDNDSESNPKVDFQIKSEFYDYYMGGEDIENIVTKFLLNEFERVNKMDISQEPYALQRIRDAADKVKVELSLSQQAEVSLPFLAADHTGPKHLNTRISRSKFETLIDPLITKLKENCENFLKTNSIDKKSIDDVILVGGISRIPRVQEIVKLIFGKEANKSINPEEAPALGASIIGSQIKLKIDELKTIDKLPLSIGIETLGGTFTRLISKDTLVPFKMTKTFTTVFDNQPKFDLKFYMGEREIACENKFLGSFTVNVPLTTKGECKINLTMNINEKGDLSLQAEETLSKKKSNYSTKYNTDLTMEYVEDALEIGELTKDADNAKKDLISLKVEADNFVYKFEKILSENKGEVENSGEVDMEKLESDIGKLNELLEGEEFEEIINVYEVLQKDLQALEGVLRKE